MFLKRWYQLPKKTALQKIAFARDFVGTMAVSTYALAFAFLFNREYLFFGIVYAVFSIWCLLAFRELINKYNDVSEMELFYQRKHTQQRLQEFMIKTQQRILQHSVKMKNNKMLGNPNLN